MAGGAQKKRNDDQMACTKSHLTQLMGKIPVSPFEICSSSSYFSEEGKIKSLALAWLPPPLSLPAHRLFCCYKDISL